MVLRSVNTFNLPLNFSGYKIFSFLFSRKKIVITSGYWAIFVVVRHEKVAAHFAFFTSLALKFKTKAKLVLLRSLEKSKK
jgi:hypothetical protein